jgi:holo-[acyl-carrier protein] synthase
VIIGLGSDLCNIERIAASVERFGDRFEQRVFTDVERAKAARRPFTKAGTLAKRFAAKEAFSAPGFAQACSCATSAWSTQPAVRRPWP